MKIMKNVGKDGGSAAFVVVDCEKQEDKNFVPFRVVSL